MFDSIIHDSGNLTFRIMEGNRGFDKVVESISNITKLILGKKGLD